MNRIEFFTILGDFFQPSDLTRINWAYWMAKKTHLGQLRDDGSRYFEHPREVARLLVMEFSGHDADEVIEALLHDAPEDGYLPYDGLEQLFGKVIANEVHILSKFAVSPLGPSWAMQKRKKDNAAYWDTIARASERVRRVKCGDRLHNLRTTSAWHDRARLERYLRESEGRIMDIARATHLGLAEAIARECALLDARIRAMTDDGSTR